MTNKNLGTICNGHVVHADRNDYGVLHKNCITLAELAATAVDFPRTGNIVTMPSHLKPKLYPDFMGKEQRQSHKSNKILVRLYRQIKDAYDKDLDPAGLKHELGDIPYDTDIEVLGSTEFMTEAWDQKCSYDDHLNGLLRKYKVKREEVVTGQIWSIPKYSNKKLGDLQKSSGMHTMP